jgi:2-polyprenyl-3-methyl-5-hydroxy-6-metoxy-1,4-benzoquinol methylase
MDAARTWNRLAGAVGMKSREVYELWHQRTGPDEAVADTPWHRMVMAHLDPLRDLAGKRVLEIGCGRGGFLCWLARNSPAHGASWFGIDHAASAINHARALAELSGTHEISWGIGDIEAIGYRSASFDTVISCETIEHVPHPQRAIHELARVLKPGGRLLLTTPNYLGPLGVYRLYLRLRGRRFTEVGQPINHFTTLPRTLSWVGRAGLRVIELDGVGHYLTIPGRSPLRVRRLDGLRFITRWVALHSMVVASKPAVPESDESDRRGG